MLTAIYWTKRRVLNEEARESIQLAAVVCCPIGETKEHFSFFLKGVLVNNDLFGAGSHAVCPTELDSEEVVET